MIQSAHLVFQGLNHLALLGKLIITSISFGFFPISKVFPRWPIVQLGAALQPVNN